MATDRKMFYGQVYFDTKDYTNSFMLEVGKYSATQRGLNAAAKKLRSMFPDAVRIAVGWSKEIAERYTGYPRKYNY
jgi:hypothetical protein